MDSKWRTKEGERDSLNIEKNKIKGINNVTIYEAKHKLCNFYL